MNEHLNTLESKKTLIEINKYENLNQLLTNSFDYQVFFPYKTVRKEQDVAINFILNAFINENKKFVICDAPTGIGKSAIAMTVLRYINNKTTTDIEFAQG